MSGPILKSDLAFAECHMVNLICHLSKGRECFLANKDFAEPLRISEATASRYIGKLEKRGYITRAGGRNSRRLSGTEAGWALLGSSGKEGEAAVAPASPPTPEAEAKPAKEKKKNPTVAEHKARELPDYIPRDTWEEFVEMRQAEHGPFSDRAAKGVVTEISNLRAEGHDPRLLLELATRRCWQSVHPDKGGATKAKLGGDRRRDFGAML